MNTTRRETNPPCIWMDAGVIAWRLCDRDFDCESCPLDRALRGALAGTPRLDVPPHANGVAWPADRWYHPAHLWIRPRRGGGVRCGLDRAAAALLAPGGALVLPAPGQQLRRGRPAFWVLHESGPLPLRAPIDGRVVTRNPRLVTEPALPFEDPLEAGWLVDVASVGEAAATEGLLAAAAAEARAAHQLERLRRRALSAAGHTATAPDGGEPAPDLMRRLGARRWRRLVLPLLS